jgi:flavin-dependent dehydrogenase
MRDGGAALRLRDGSRIAVVGGGPSGALFAHFAAKLAAAHGIGVEIAVFDGKSFARTGPAGCNMGAGVVSESANRLLRAEGFELPEERVQRHIRGYRLYTRDTAVTLRGPQGERDISAVFRGAGPRFSAAGRNTSFDDFLVQHVVEEYPDLVNVIPERVEELVLPRRPGERVLVRFGQGGVLEADLAVGAFGLNSAMLQRLTRMGFGYRPPRVVRACQAELPLDPDFIRDELGDSVHTFVLGQPGIRFAALTPKDQHVTATVVGHQDAGLDDLHRFLDHPVVRSVLPPGWERSGQTCFCFPRLSVGAAAHPYADRLVVVGDAAFCRYYKNGFESALLTSRLAAEAAFREGISARAFAQGYARRALPLLRDNLCGHLLFALNDWLSCHSALAETRRRLLVGRDDDPTVALMHRLLWGMVTGNLSYWQMLLMVGSPWLLAQGTATLAGVVLDGATRPMGRAMGWRT